MLPWACSEADGEYEVETAENLPLQAKFENRFNCPPGQYNESILLGSRDDAINDILTNPADFEARTLLTCGFAFLFLSIITLELPCLPGCSCQTHTNTCSLNVPLLTGSSLLGSACILTQRHIMPPVSPAPFALLEATCLLAGIQRTTVSLVVIMMEANEQGKVLIPLIVTVVYVGDAFNEEVHRIGMELKEYPYLSMHVSVTLMCLR